MTKGKKIKVWITKHALTQGISCIEAEAIDDRTIVYGDVWRVYFHGDDWHRTAESAMAQAAEMQRKAVISCERKLSKLKSMKFDVPSEIPGPWPPSRTSSLTKSR